LPRRAPLYENGGTPQQHNETVIQNLQSDPNINPSTYDGTVSQYYASIQTDIQNQQSASGN